MNEPIISFIIPAYNVQDYIEECVEAMSALNVAKEIIVVNDGSTDLTYHKVVELQKKDPSIILLDQTNRGQSAARNEALKLCKGKFVYFCDSDDYIYTEKFLKLLSYTTGNNLDACAMFFKNQKYENKTRIYYSEMAKVFKRHKILSGIDFIQQTLANGSYGSEVCLYLFKKNVLDGLFFPTDMKKHEDDFYIPSALAKASRIGFIEETVYFRRYRENSVSRGLGDRPSRSVADIIKNINYYVNKASESDINYRRAFSNLAVRSLLSLLDYTQYSEEAKKLKFWEIYFSIDRSNVNLKWKIKFLKSMFKHQFFIK